MSVVVMSRNRREELLASLGRHRAPVILVDNGSTDGTVEAVRAAYPHIDVIPLGRNIGAQARTFGVRCARTPYVAFADDDSWWAPGALRAAADLLDAHDRLAVVAARILVGSDEELDPLCAQMARSPLATGPRLPGRRVLGFVACGAVVRVEPFLAVGGFDAVVRFPGEEERVALDLTAVGWSIAYCPEVVAHHHPSDARRGPADRRRAVTRSSLLTALMRLPWPRVRKRVEAAWREPVTRAGVLRALLDTPAALAARRLLPQSVLTDLDVLDGPTPAGAGGLR